MSQVLTDTVPNTYKNNIAKINSPMNRIKYSNAKKPKNVYSYLKVKAFLLDP